MKKVLGLLIALSLGAAGCSAANNGCQAMPTCDAGGTWQSCCQNNQCYYITGDGTTYPCQGLDCTGGADGGAVSAAQQVTAWCAAH